jgi:hypothetical protein
VFAAADMIARQGDAMASKFERERSQVELLMQRLGVAPAEYLDPQAGGHARRIDMEDHMLTHQTSESGP